MSRTFRTNKYGEVKTDKFKKGFNGCGCAYCDFIHNDSRNVHRDLHCKNEVMDGKDYIDNMYDEHLSDLDKEDYLLNKIDGEILKHNQELIN